MTKLFDEINEKDKEILLKCLNAVKKNFLKGEMIIEAGQKQDSVAYIEKGSIDIVKDNFDGSKIILNTIGQWETFAEAIVCSGAEKSPNYVFAKTDATILFINIKKILNPCSEVCSFHKKLLKNLIKIIAQKNVFLNQRLELLTQKSLRERILFYLNNYRKKFDTEIFEIPHSREEMSQYLGVNRSALSRELCKMKKEKLIDFHKNSFRLFS